MLFLVYIEHKDFLHHLHDFSRQLEQVVLLWFHIHAYGVLQSLHTMLEMLHQRMLPILDLLQLQVLLLHRFLQHHSSFPFHLQQRYRSYLKQLRDILDVLQDHQMHKHLPHELMVYACVKNLLHQQLALQRVLGQQIVQNSLNLHTFHRFLFLRFLHQGLLLILLLR